MHIDWVDSTCLDSSSCDNGLFDFINNNGGYVHPSIERKRGVNGIYGIYTKSEIKKDEPIFRIPESLTINMNTNKIEYC